MRENRESDMSDWKEEDSGELYPRKGLAKVGVKVWGVKVKANDGDANIGKIKTCSEIGLDLKEAVADKE